MEVLWMLQRHKKITNIAREVNKTLSPQHIMYPMFWMSTPVNNILYLNNFLQTKQLTVLLIAYKNSFRFEAEAYLRLAGQCWSVFVGM